MLPHLSKFTQLTELRAMLDSTGAELDWDKANLPVLKSLQVLHLTLFNYNTIPSTHFYRALPVIFPNLREVTVVGSNPETLNNFRFCFAPTRFPRLTSAKFYANFNECYDEGVLIGRHLQYRTYEPTN